MAFITVNYSDGVVDVDFGQLSYDNDRVTEVRGVFRQAEIVDVVQHTTFVSIKLKDERRSWKCQPTPLFLTSGERDMFPIDSVNGEPVDDLDELYDLLEGIIS